MASRSEKLDIPDQTLSTSNIARYCRTSVVNVNRWITTGQLEAYRYPSGRYKITKENFRKFLEENNIPIIESFFESSKVVKVLIGEDDEDIARGIKAMLLKHYSDMEVEVYNDGYDVLLKMGSVKPHILILDIELPTINGLEVCRRIKEQNEFFDVRILAITAHSKEYRREDVLKAGANDLLLKPFTARELFKYLENLLDNKLELAKKSY